MTLANSSASSSASAPNPISTLDELGEPRRSAPLTTDRILVPHVVRPSIHISGHEQSDHLDNLGVFATEHIPAGTVSVVMGGFVTPGPIFRTLDIDRQRHSLQIGEDLFLACDETLCDGDMINHSCDPSIGFVGEITLVALRDIEPGDELTFDYATCDSDPYDEFECACAASDCRGKVTGEDWLLPTVQDRYEGHFSPYLQRRIDRIRRGPATTD